jgi:3-oxoadipate enol-lactonase
VSPTKEDERRIRLAGHSLRCVLSGRGEPVFVCLHGLVDTLAIWDALAGPLAERGRVVRVDQRAHGESDTPPGPYAREDLAGDVAGVLGALAIDRAILVGHSMGGVVAMTTALLHPERVAGLVLLGTASQCSERVAAWYERIARAGEEEGLEGLARTIYGPSARRRIRGDSQGIAHVTRTLESLFDDPLTPKLAALACPVLLLVGEKDPMGPKASQIIHDALPAGRARLEVIAGRGHWLHVEAAPEVVRAFDRWRTGLRDGGGIG